MMRAFATALVAGALLAAPALAQADRAAPAEPVVPPGVQFLYGSGEAAAMSRQTYRAFEQHALRRAAERPIASVILSPDATLAAPAFLACGDKPLAAVFDVDETVALNTAMTRSQVAREPRRFGALLPTRPVPGVVEAIRALKAAGIKPIYNTNRTMDMADMVAATIESFGLDKPVVGETLFLSGYDEMGGNKDGRRWIIADTWCVVAMAGDQLGDFSEMLKAVPAVADRRAATLAAPIEAMWGNGWYMLPNTSYGTALEGSLDDVFPELAGAANDNEEN